MNSADSYLDDFRKRNIEVSSGPVALAINSAGRCNLACHMCWHSSQKEIEIDIDVGKLDAFLQRAGWALLLGGEPLWMNQKVNKTASDIFNRILSAYPDIRISAFTNGVMLDEKMTDIVMEHFHEIVFSIDSVDPAVYEKVRSQPVLDKVLENMKRLHERKRKAGLGPDEEPRISVNSIVMQSTLDGLPAVARTLARLGGYKHFLANFRNLIGPEFNEKFAEEMVDYDAILQTRLDPVRRELEDLYNKSGIEPADQAKLLSCGNPPKPDPSSPEAVCSLPWTDAIIAQNGDVRFCCANFTVLGNLNRDSFEEIWNGQAMREVRESFVSGEMSGCMSHACISAWDYFTVDADLYLKNLLKRLERQFGKTGANGTILLLRTAPMRQTQLVAQTLMKHFSGARLTVVTNSAGAGECSEWGIGAEVVAYPENPESFFRPEHFARWWAGRRSKERYSIAAAVYANGDGKGYENINEIMHGIDADKRIGIKPGGGLVVFS
ncbi:MAG: radical SAM protein [Nitrospinota bacterium]